MSVVIILRFDTYPRHESMLKSGKKMTHILVAESDINPTKSHKYPHQHCSNHGKTKQEQAVSLPYDVVNASRMPDLGQSGMHAQYCRARG